MRLLPSVLRKIQGDFNIKNLADVANWADEVKDARRQKPWHYANVEISSDSYERGRDCPDGQCVIEKIPIFESVLKDGSVSLQERREALKYLVHLTADAHQPLHLGNREDRGGNEIRVRFEGRQTNLHALWDGEMISFEKFRSLPEYARALNGTIGDGDASAWPLSGTADWANESRRLALDFAYLVQVSDSGELAPDYVSEGRRIVETQLLKAGVRLAELLNRSLK